jgi:hypothetical protein
MNILENINLEYISIEKKSISNIIEFVND